MRYILSIFNIIGNLFGQKSFKKRVNRENALFKSKTTIRAND